MLCPGCTEQGRRILCSPECKQHLPFVTQGQVAGARQGNRSLTQGATRDRTRDKWSQAKKVQAHRANMKNTPGRVSTEHVPLLAPGLAPACQRQQGPRLLPSGTASKSC